MENSKSFWQTVKNIWQKIIDFKGTKYIVVLGIAAIVFAIVAVNANSVYVIEATGKEGEKAVFIGVENSSYYYTGSKMETNPDGSSKGDEYHEVWYVVEGYTSKSSYESGAQPVFNSDTYLDNYYEKGKFVDKVAPFYFSNDNITSTNAKGVMHRIATVVKKREEEATRRDGTTYMKMQTYPSTIWYQLTASDISKLESYTYATFIELTKYKTLYDASYFRVTFRLDDNNLKYFRDFEI